MKPDALAAPIAGYEGAAPLLVKASLVRRLAAQIWWLVCLLPAVVLLAVAATA